MNHTPYVAMIAREQKDLIMYRRVEGMVKKMNTITIFDEQHDPKYQIEECECPRCHAQVRFIQPASMINTHEELKAQKKMFEEIIHNLQEEMNKLDFELRVKKIELYNTHQFLLRGRE